MKAFVPTQWSSSNWQIALLTAILVFVATSSFDQFIRNRVDEHMYGYALRELLPVSIDDYQALPIHWRQAISELSIRRKFVGDAESKVLFATLEHFNVQQLKLVDKIVVPYMMFDFLARDPSQRDTQHPVPNAVYADFLDLESLGVLQSVVNGTLIRRNITSDRYVIHTESYTVPIYPGQDSTNLEFPTTRISEPWVQLIELLRVPTDGEYIEWFAEKIRESGFSVVVTRKDQKLSRNTVGN